LPTLSANSRMHSTPISLLERLRTGTDTRSWHELVNIYEPWLRGWLLAHFLQNADADDVVQESLTVLVEELPAFQHNGRTGAFRSWLRQIVLNRLREFRRKKKDTLNTSEEILNQLADDNSTLSQLWDREHDEYIIKQLLKRIASDFEPITWQAFEAFVIQQQPANVVAQQLGITPGAVWTAKSHILKRLRQEAKDLLD